jgi:transcriptional regulator with XRE-family HTH domain
METRLSKNQTNALKDELEKRKYGKNLTSMELASKANVSIDDVNRFERHRPIDDPTIQTRSADALRVTTDLLSKIAGTEEIATETLSQLERRITESKSTGTTSAACQRLGLRPVQH